MLRSLPVPSTKYVSDTLPRGSLSETAAAAAAAEPRGIRRRAVRNLESEFAEADNEVVTPTPRKRALPAGTFREWKSNCTDVFLLQMLSRPALWPGL
jgi:hypothetical protein